MHIHLLHQKKIQGKALSLLLESHNHQVQLVQRPKNNLDIFAGKKHSDVFLMNVEFLLAFNKAIQIKKLIDQQAIVLLGKLCYLHHLIAFKTNTKGFVSAEAHLNVLLNTLNKVKKKKAIFLGLHCRDFLQKTKLERQHLLFPEQFIKPLTKTELRVMRELSLGKTTNDIAKEHYRSIYTIQNHRKNIKRKFRYPEVTELKLFCMLNRDAIQTLLLINENRIPG